MDAFDPRRLDRRAVLKGVAALSAIAGATGRSPALARHAAPEWSRLAQDLPNAEVIAGNTAFAFDLYAEMQPSVEGNLLVSPYSVSVALAMTYAGARGETAAQMREALSFTTDQPALHDAFNALNADLVARGNAEADPDAYQNARALRIANALWGEQSYPFSADYIAALEQSYGAGLRTADFQTAPEDAREEINTWVEDQTEDRIQDIVPPSAITPLTRLVLANAIYFSGSWMLPFNPDDTEDDDFHLLDGTTVTVPLMFQHDAFSYAPGDGYQVIEFDYAGDMGDTSGFALTLVLPDEGQFEAVEAGWDAEAFNAAIDNLSYTEEVRVWLPKFEFEFGTASLVPALEALGMTDAFDADRADFTGMVEGTPPEPLLISDVLHKTFIGVDEEGTEAAAATVVLIAAGAAADMPTPPPPIEVRIDRPFLFAIRDTGTGTVLFLGRVLDPSA